MAELVAGVESVGIEEFLRKGQIADRRIGTVTVEIPNTTPTKYLVESIRR